MATVELNQVDLNHKNKYLRILILIIICTGCMDHKKEIYFGFNENPYSTDSYDYDAYVNQVYQSAIYGTLLSGNSSNEIAPALAKSWRQSSDFKEWELDLNENLFFSNGDTIDCLSAKKSLQRISFLMKSKGSRDGFLEYLVNFEKMKNANDNVLGISCHGNTIRFVFQIPMKDFASKITFGLYSIVHPKSFDSESGVWFDKSNSISSFSYVSSRDINNEPISLVLRKDFNLKIGHDKKFEKINIINNKELEKLDALISISSQNNFYNDFQFSGGSNSGIFYLRIASWDDPNSPFFKLSNRQIVRDLFYSVNNSDCKKKCPKTFFPISNNIYDRAEDPVSVELPDFKNKIINIHMVSEKSNSPYSCVTKSFTKTLEKLGAKVVFKEVTLEKAREEIRSSKKSYSVDVYTRYTTVLDPYSARFMFLSNEGILLPDPSNEAKKEFEKANPQFETLNEILWKDAIIFPLDHFNHGIFYKDYVDISKFSNRYIPIDFNWVGSI
ncbi:MAG: hypothetical protein COW00_19535 [Bdellovibrio sp. CG12_big_fil_rev_8_21_14_0_65_39_13]|nr:MAG: hypothetical protein COW78_03725 [Bdellovibrio sp. CG22_combo_CG10-13_8_21_14_all_39_27]PIQ57681.1 MAG: hypothetical protein COW00_19535 [Bdellovibrio sp. CG12_big_fil_rev_8_21_14_0_65_39_13]PIR35193.1 MAG: hypothetical protein COV37_09790 [Bdellovibrio sp. CG11_big_fil_rev_8_21_14_0_20_39_38]